MANALCLGANAVMVGRSTLYGVAAGGEAGAARALEIFRSEIHRNIALLGVDRLEKLGPQYLKFIDQSLRPASVRAPLRAVPYAKVAGA